ncbi:hypothetical protein [Botrimarina hoheduenensis]|uniref:PEP-CTERM protein-sorting domain-containing protein n=1 Tax=Botrimarina hoheduenensis TaxID=2528000 RepID=A0A5C5W8F6_9BACT|nr:hypothetical protein [Botrimarina hoheduenensis]TWT46884.1 hypothetical protein Pla111_19860 [Botrimarina hoheduenensis]
MSRLTLRGGALTAACLLINFSLIGSVPSQADAQIVASDNFSDFDRDNDGVSDDGNATPVTTNDGIAWYAINGLTSTGDPRSQKPGLTVIDGSPLLGDGAALFVEAVGSNGEFMGVMPSTVDLGAAVGSKITISFDFWLQDDFLPASGEFRFGFYGDTDNQFGSAATNDDGSPTVWGGSDGNFDAEDPGAIGDVGAFVRVQFGGLPTLDGSQTRLNEESNVNNILGGAGDGDLVIIAGAGEFGVINDVGRHSFQYILERSAPSITGATVRQTLIMTDSDNVVWTLTGLDGDDSENDTIVAGESFDYFVGLVNTDADYVIDNFQVELSTSTPAVSGDFNGDGKVDNGDLNLLLGSWGSATVPAAWINGFDTPVDNGELNALLGNWGFGVGVAVPEPTAALLALLAAAGTVARRR